MKVLIYWLGADGLYHFDGNKWHLLQQEQRKNRDDTDMLSEESGNQPSAIDSKEHLALDRPHIADCNK